MFLAENQEKESLLIGRRLGVRHKDIKPTWCIHGTPGVSTGYAKKSIWIEDLNNGNKEIRAKP